MLRDVSSVLVAKELNADLFSQLWLLENGILLRDEIASNSMFTPVAVSVTTTHFDFTFLQNKLQVSVRSDFEKSGELFRRISGGVLNALPSQPWVAAGLNLNFTLEGEDGEAFSASVREMVLSDKNPVASEFSDENVRCGFYVSKDYQGARLKLDTKPIVEAGQDKLYLNFNFHKNVTSSREASAFLENWESFYHYAASIIDSFDSELRKQP